MEDQKERHWKKKGKNDSPSSSSEADADADADAGADKAEARSIRCNSKCFPTLGGGAASAGGVGCFGGVTTPKEEDEEAAGTATRKTKKRKKSGSGGGLRVNPCLVFLNVLFACVGMLFVGVGVWLSLNHGTNCVHFLQTFLIGAGFFMVGVAAAGIAGAVWGVRSLLYFNFLMLLLLLILVVGTTVFVLFVTSKGISATLRSSHDPFSAWLRNQVNQRIRSCTHNGQICRFVDYSYSTGYYSRPRLSALQAACCRPPEGCYRNGSEVQNSNETAMAIEADCEAWRKAGVTTGFCSKCSLCRAAVAENIRHVWHTVAIFKVIMLLILLPAYFITCCNFKKDNGDDDDDDDGDEERRRECQRCLDCCFNVL